MFTRVRNPGGWFLGSVVTAAEFEKFDAMRPNAIDGLDGGTYAPSALLSIGGLAITLNPTTLTLSAAAMAVSAPGTWSAAQTANAAWTFAGAVALNGATTIGAAGTVTSNSASSVALSGTFAMVGTAGDRYPILTSFTAETRDYLNIHMTTASAAIALGLYVATAPCIAATPTTAKVTWVEITPPIGASVTGVSVTWAGNIAGGALTAATYEIVSVAGSPDGTPTTMTTTALSSVVTDSHAGTFLQMNTETITPTTGSFTVATTKRYFVIITHYYSGGGGAQSEIYRVRATFTPAKIQPR